jgi:peptide/nickel transport system permease protein
MFIVVRLLLLVPMIFTMLTLVFVILRVIPGGDPIKALAGGKLSEDVLRNMRHELGLDKPLQVQYLEYVVNVFQGNFGTSIRTRRPVLEMILEAFPATVEYTIPTMILAIVTGVQLGAYSGYKRNRPFDLLNRISTIVVYSMPLFWLGMLLQLTFGLYLSWLPISGRIDPRIPLTRITGLLVLDSILTGNIPALIDSLLHLILPSITMMAWISCMINRVSRTEMINVLRQDFITSARSRGLPERMVLYEHALKNALVPIVTLMGLVFAWMLGGNVVAEVTFSIYGIGRLLVSAIYSRDFPLIQGCVVFYVIIVALLSLAIDIVYAYIDPRIRL